MGKGKTDRENDRKTQRRNTVAKARIGYRHTELKNQYDTQLLLSDMGGYGRRENARQFVHNEPR